MRATTKKTRGVASLALVPAQAIQLHQYDYQFSESGPSAQCPLGL